MTIHSFRAGPFKAQFVESLLVLCFIATTMHSSDQDGMVLPNKAGQQLMGNRYCQVQWESIQLPPRNLRGGQCLKLLLGGLERGPVSIT